MCVGPGNIQIPMAGEQPLFKLKKHISAAIAQAIEERIFS